MWATAKPQSGVAPVLTDSVIRNFKPLKKVQRVFDGSGLYLEVSPSGGKWWRFKYRFLGKEKRISVGVYPDVGLRKARELRDEYRKLVAHEWLSKHGRNWAPIYTTHKLRLSARSPNVCRCFSETPPQITELLLRSLWINQL